jgi:hypothetical protein
VFVVRIADEFILAHGASVDLGSVCYDWALKKFYCGTWGCGQLFICMKRNSEVVMTVVEL